MVLMFRQSMNGAEAAVPAAALEMGKVDAADVPSKEPKAARACRREKRVVMKRNLRG
ncbi:hypothetical protein GCM10028817_06130 [Spirosoma pomorum]